MPQSTLTEDMIAAPLGRHIRYWYTYRTAVAVVMAVVLSVAIFGLYAQQAICDAGLAGCYVNVAAHPEDRLFSTAPPNPAIEVVGLADASVAKIGTFAGTRNVYAPARRPRSIRSGSRRLGSSSCYLISRAGQTSPSPETRPASVRRGRFRLRWTAEDPQSSTSSPGPEAFKKRTSTSRLATFTTIRSRPTTSAAK